MEIKIENPAEFQRLLEELGSELQEANIHFKLFQDLIAAADEYATEFAQANAFWSLTVQAHLDATLFRLCKIYDQHNRALNLKNLLDTIKANLSIFDVENFRERFKNSPFVESLSSEPRKPDAVQLDADMAFVSEDNTWVKNLVIWRNNYFAHRSPHHAIEDISLASTHTLPMPEVKRLAVEGMRILNRYSSLFHANTYSTNIIGREDYKSVLDAVREHLQAVERRVQEDIARFRNPPQ